ncbi:MAG: YceI family protein, partial [Chitinophagaceae bacterium]|nr:YceI family protein [Chitinophagaceae bacterium]
LMQSHFNRAGYLNSDKFPTSEFTGTIQNINEVNFSVNGQYKVTAKGKLTIKGITKNIQANGTLNIENKKAKLNSTIKVNAADYNIDNSEVAELIDVVIQCSYTLH